MEKLNVPRCAATDCAQLVFFSEMTSCGNDAMCTCQQKWFVRFIYDCVVTACLSEEDQKASFDEFTTFCTENGVILEPFPDLTDSHPTDSSKQNTNLNPESGSLSEKAGKSSNSSNSNSLPKSTIIGISVGASVFLILLFLCSYIAYRAGRRKTKRRIAEELPLHSKELLAMSSSLSREISSSGKTVAPPVPPKDGQLPELEGSEVPRLYELDRCK